MSSGASVTSAYALQTDKDVLPTTGWKILPNVSNGLNNSMNLTDSEMVTQGRIKVEGMVSGGEVTGDISAELMFASYDDLIASAFWSAWQTDANNAKLSTLKIGSQRSFYAVTKDFTDIDVFHCFTGVHLSSLNLEVSTDALIKLTFGMLGLGYQHSTSETFAKTPAPAMIGKQASGLSIGTILIAGNPIGVCVESFSFSLDNQTEVQKCLGNNLYGGNVLAMLANVTGKMTLAYSQEAHNLVKNQLTGTVIAIEVPIEFATGEKYLIKIPQAQIKGDVPSPSGTDVVTIDVEYTIVNESPIIERYSV